MDPTDPAPAPAAARTASHASEPAADTRRAAELRADSSTTAASVHISGPMPFAHLVVDANAYIAGARLRGLAPRVWSVAGARDEVRSAAARAAMELMPEEVGIRQPSPACVAAVVEFARKTGDAARLSRVDVQLLALTLQLEREMNAHWATYIRTEPPTQATRLAMRERTSMPACKFFGTAGGCREGDACRYRHEDARQDDARTAGDAHVRADGDASVSAPGVDADVRDDGDEEEWIGPVPLPGADGQAASKHVGWDASKTHIPWGKERIPLGLGTVDAVVDEAAAQLAAARLAAGEVDSSASASTEPSVDVVAHPSGAPLDLAAACDAQGGGDVDGDGAPDAAADEEDDDDENPDDSADIADVLSEPPSDAASMSTAPAAPRRVPVALLTSDYPMQNVALQMGLLLATHSGKVVRSVKTWVLRCDACFTIAPDTDRLFCPRCGNAALARLGVTLGADGAPRYHYKKNRQVNVRGTIFPLGNPKGSRASTATHTHTHTHARADDLLLREDMLLTGKWAARVRQGAASNARDMGMFADRLPSDDWAVSGSLSHTHTHTRAHTGGHGQANTHMRDPRRAAVYADVEVGHGRRNPNARRGRRK